MAIKSLEKTNLRKKTEGILLLDTTNWYWALLCAHAILCAPTVYSFFFALFQNKTKCSAHSVTRIGLLEEIPRSGVQIPCLYLMGHYRCTRTLCYQAQTPVWSESSVDEHNLYFARSAIIGYLAVETWRVKTEFIIITILHIIIITISILNLDFKTFAQKILAHTTCINRYWKYTYTNICSKKSKQKLIAKIDKTHCKNWAELTAKSSNSGACLK
jgi:hypothetical protein